MTTLSLEPTSAAYHPLPPKSSTSPPIVRREIVSNQKQRTVVPEGASVYVEHTPAWTPATSNPPPPTTFDYSRAVWDQYGQFTRSVQSGGLAWANPYASPSFMPPTPTHDTYAHAVLPPHRVPVPYVSSPIPSYPPPPPPHAPHLVITTLPSPSAPIVIKRPTPAMEATVSPEHEIATLKLTKGKLEGEKQLLVSRIQGMEQVQRENGRLSTLARAAAAEVEELKKERRRNWEEVGQLEESKSASSFAATLSERD